VARPAGGEDGGSRLHGPRHPQSLQRGNPRGGISVAAVPEHR
jgi:hypothetical protein